MATQPRAEGISRKWTGLLAHTCNSSTQEVKAGGSRVWGQPRLQSKSQRGVEGEGMLSATVTYKGHFFMTLVCTSVAMVG